VCSKNGLSWHSQGAGDESSVSGALQCGGLGGSEGCESPGTQFSGCGEPLLPLRLLNISSTSTSCNTWSGGGPIRGSVIGGQSISAVWDEKVQDKAYCRYCALPRLQSPAVPSIHTPSRRIGEQDLAPLGSALIAGRNSVAEPTS